MKRRSFIFAVSAIVAARHALAASLKPGRLGICTFSCHRHWEAVRKEVVGIRFNDASSFYGYVRELGADGVQTSLSGLDSSAVKALRNRIEADGCYLEGDLRLPRSAADLVDFEHEVRLIREAGASVARAVLTGGRRYEVFKTMTEFRQFLADASKRLGMLETILRKHGLKLAIENHKQVESNPPKQPPPAITGKPMSQQLSEEESNNRISLRWMHQHLA
jgi:3-oxoisoapionate decarboxylase